MKTVGIFEAKTNLSRLLEEVERGRDVMITRRGKPVAVPRKALEPWLRERGLVAHVSISDEVQTSSGSATARDSMQTCSNLIPWRPARRAASRGG